MKHTGASGSLFLALVFANCVSSYGQQVLLTDDAQISSTATSNNYGAGTTLTINSTTSVLLKPDAFLRRIVGDDELV